MRSTVDREVDEAPTPRSIAAAKQAAADERQRLFEITGVLVHDDGRVDLISRPASSAR